VSEIDLALAILTQDPDVRAVYLFGSQARAQDRPDSDLDLGVLLSAHLSDREVWKKRLQLGALAAQSLKRELDLFILGEADLDLTFRILQQGRRLYERDRSKVRAREAYLVSLYYDYQPFLEHYLKRTAEHFCRAVEQSRC
jgi:predicted nucleotidyltransferase